MNNFPPTDKNNKENIRCINWFDPEAQLILQSQEENDKYTEKVMNAMKQNAINNAKFMEMLKKMGNKK